MSAKEFIEFRLNELKSEQKTIPKEELAVFIFNTIMSKKFRKYSMIPEYQDHIKKVISDSIQGDLPIKFSFPFGGYKLWRFEETPEVDWAELFTLMYYAKWLKPICEVYKPGIIFDFSSDDMIVQRMNNIPKKDTAQYKKSFCELINFLDKYLPENLKFTLTPVSSLYTEEEFEIDLADKIKEKKEEFGGLPVLDEKKRSMVELNVKLNPDQEKDPLWREKVELVHQAYYAVDKRRPYNRASDKILAFTYPLVDGKSISVGTTKTSVAKFWVGVGVLKKTEDSFLEYVLSPSQLESSNFTKEEVKIERLNSKNFKDIRILS